MQIKLSNHYTRKLSLRHLDENIRRSSNKEYHREVSFNLSYHEMNQDGMYALTSTTELTVYDKDKQKQLLVLKLEYIGHFLLSNIDDNLIDRILLVSCMHMLYYYIAQKIHDFTKDSVIGAVQVEYIDFNEMFVNKKRSMSNEQSENQLNNLFKDTDSII